MNAEKAKGGPGAPGGGRSHGTQRTHEDPVVVPTAGGGNPSGGLESTAAALHPNCTLRSACTGGDGEVAFTPSRTLPHSVYTRHLLCRVALTLMTLAGLGVVLASFWVRLAHVTIDDPLGDTAYSGEGFDVYLWRLQTVSVWAGEKHGAINFADPRQPFNTRMRVCMVVAAALAVLSVVLSLVFLICRGVHERARKADDDERVKAAEAARRAQHSLQLVELESGATAVPPGEARLSFVLDERTGYWVRRKEPRPSPVPPSVRRSAGYYTERESWRRCTDLALGVVLCLLLLSTAAVILAALLCGGLFLTDGEALGEALEENFKDAGTDLSEDDMEAYAKTTFQLGFWLIVVALALNIVAMLLLLVKPLSGLHLSGRGRGGEQAKRAMSGSGERGAAGERASLGSSNGARRYPFGLNEDDCTPGLRSHAFRGIPVALPGPPMDRLHVIGESTSHPSGPQTAGGAQGTKTCEEFVHTETSHSGPGADHERPGVEARGRAGEQQAHEPQRMGDTGRERGNDAEGSPEQLPPPHVPGNGPGRYEELGLPPPQYPERMDGLP